MAVVHPPTELRGRRLVVRRYGAPDVPLLHDAIVESVDHLRPWMPWAADEPIELAERERRVAGWAEPWDAGSDYGYGVFDDGLVVGGCGLHRRIGPGGIEIGYWTRVGHTGRGIATEAAGCLVEAALGLPDVEFIEIRHDVANVASGRVPEKLGFALVDEREDGVSAPGDSGIERIWRLTRSAAATTTGA